jgi:capsular exopolysaccharide synthesis family protein
MASITQKPNSNKNNRSAIGDVFFKYVPYWPIFVVFLILSLVGAWFFLRVTPKKYEIEASILIKDGKKGADDGTVADELKAINAKKVVENEIEIFRSRTLMAEVVRNLHLYCSLFEEGKFIPTSAFTTSPVKIEVANADDIKPVDKVNFSFSSKDSSVVIGANKYPLNQYVSTPYGSLRFTVNPRQRSAPHAPLFFALENPKKVTTSLLEGLTATAPTKLTSILNLKIRNADPLLGEAILGQLIEVYNRAALAEKRKLATATSTFVDEKLKEVKQELQDIEAQARNFKTSEKAVDLSTQSQLILKSSTETGQKIENIDLQLSALDEVDKYVKASSGGIFPSMVGLNDPTLPELLKQLREEELKYESLKKTTAENHPILTSIKEQINKIKPGILENINNQRATLEANKLNLHSTNNGYATMLQGLPQKELRLVDISRQQNIKANLYEYLRQKQAETELSSIEIPDTRVVDTPQASLEPVTPKSKLIYLVAFIVSLILPASLVSIKEFLNRKILFRHEIENLTSTPIIGEISLDKSKEALVIQEGKRTFVAEQFRRMRTSLGYVGGGSGKKKILVTSSLSGVGKSFVAANLELSLELTDKKVVLLDLDLANPSLSTKLNVNYEEGVSTYLWGECEPENIIKRTSFNNNLFFIPSGPLPDNPSELLMSSRLKELLSYLEDAFDVIIIDSAPASLLSDAYVLSPLCDVTLYVVKHKFTPKSYLERLDEENAVNQLNNMRIVFNGIQSRGFTKNGYGYGYGYGYIHNNGVKTKKRKYSKR